MKRLRITALVIALLMVFTISVCATELSPSLTVIRQKTALTKCGVAGTDINFKVSEFESILGIQDLKYITITKLPDIEQGVLKLGGIDVIEGQTIPRGSIEFLKFVPKDSTETETTEFSFTTEANAWDGVELKCVMNILPTINFAPVAGGCEFETVQEVATVETLAAYDPDGDAMYFELLTYPKNGTVTITDASSGSFVYTPKDGYKGKDSFKYCVTDIYGNISNEATAQVQVEKNTAEIVYADMDGHWAHAAAVKLAGQGIVSHEEIAGVYYFEPDKAMTRSDFTVMLLMAAGYDDEIQATADTGFADDALIPTSHKPYIALAKELGIISPIVEDDGLGYLKPNEELTRAEAAVMISKLLNLESNTSLAVFSDYDSIPQDAVKYVAALYQEGIMGGIDKTTMAPNATFDRAQTATVLVRVIEYLDEQEEEDTGGILSWFGFK